MKTHRRLTLLLAILIVIFSDGCRRSAPDRPVGEAETEVTFYPTYAYRDGDGWRMRLRGWAHEDRKHLNSLVAVVAELRNKCAAPEMATFKARSDDFEDDDDSGERVRIKFDKDPDDKTYEFPQASDLNGIVSMDLTLTDAAAKRLLEEQGSTNGWLTFKVVSEDHAGVGQVILIEPEGVSLVSDIDDTIKVTGVPAGKDAVLEKTFCKEFKAADGMKALYEELGSVPVHYVSGGPEQLYGPLYDYLITGDGGFPEGTFHLKFFPKNVLTSETRSNLKQFAASSLDVTFNHKLGEIKELMDRFPKRQFILSGDSGEIDPEVYAQIRKERGAQVKEIWIRDVINESGAQPTSHAFRLEGMRVIKVEKPTCVHDEHFAKLSEKLMKLYANVKYERSNAPCER